MATRLGIDVGGTFTDLVFYDDETGEVRVAKGPTTPASPDVGVAQLVSQALTPRLISSAEYFLHGTTIGINALLERKGAVVGLLVTRGFRDVLEMRRGDRDAMYDMLWKPLEPLVPRRLRVEVTERVRADGTVDTPFGALRVKVKRLGDRVVVAPEYDDASRLARERGVPLAEIYRAVARLDLPASP